MKKKLVALLLCAAMVSALAACGSSGGATTQGGADGTTAAAGGETTVAQSSSGINAYFDDINEDAVEVSEFEWYRGPITVYQTATTGSVNSVNPEGTFVYGIMGNIQGAYPPTNQQENVWCFNVYESLWQRNPETGTLDPWLATDGEYDDEGNFHITLREGVKFHDGNTMTAEDVLYTLKVSSEDPKARAYQHMQKIDFDNCVIEDDTHLVLAFKQPIGSLIDILASGYLSIMSKEFVENAGKDYPYLEDDAGTGAYKLVETVTDLSQTFEAFDDYWGGKPEIQTITAKKYTDNNVIYIDYLNGALDLTMRVPYQDAVTALSGATTDTTMYRIPNNRYKYVFFNTNDERSPMHDERVRKAFVECLNYAEMVYSVFESYAMGDEQMTSIFMPGTSYKTDIGVYEYNPDDAIALLKEAGYDESNPCVLKLITSNQNNNDKIAELMQGYCDAIGIKLEPEIVKSSALKDAKDGLMESSEYDILINTGDFANGSPTGALAGVDAYGLEKGEFNPMKGVVDEEFHNLYDEAETTEDEALRAEDYAKIQQLFHDHVYCLPLMPDVMIAAAHPWVKNVTFTSGYTLRFADIKLDK